ncbi:MAG: DNA repair protein RecO [Microscillaceae bacterium]|jgi:DNA repair protein RecO (recombination protein O)|nr:DNA repair protein RecO [Microscillaceae bacterium]
MLQKTRGIVINYLKYRESSIIVKVYTEELGLQTYIVNSVRSAKAKTGKIALYQPLTLLDLVVYFHKNRPQINRIAEVKCNFPFQTIPFDIAKSTTALFLTEVLHKTLKEETANSYLFNFLNDSIQLFDNQAFTNPNFHLVFLLKLTRFFGFEPSSAEDIFEQITEHKKILLPEEHVEILKYHLNQLLEADYLDNVILMTGVRSDLIDYILDFYQLHVANFDNLKSLAVLRELNR